MRRVVWSVGLFLVALAGVLAFGSREAPRASDAEPPASSMRAILREIAGRAPDDDLYNGSLRARTYRKQLAELPEDAPVLERLDLLRRAATEELNLGNVRRAVAQYEEGLRQLRDMPVPGRLKAEWQYEAGLAWLQLGERQNCCSEHNADSCIFPIRGAGVHRHREGSAHAAACFERVLALTKPGEPMRAKAAWLLNLAHMTLGSWPEGVREDARVDVLAQASSEPFPRFRNIAPEIGLDSYDCAGGAAVEDFDGDGFLDILTSSWSPLAPMHYFRNRGDGRFEELTREAGLDGLLGGLNLVQADYDNDGDVDVFVLRGAWLDRHGRHPNSLLRNDGKGHFEDVTFAAGLGAVHYPTQTAAWADYDCDGDLDLYVGNESSGHLLAPCQLFLNRGDGTFVDMARWARVENGRYTKGVTWGDYDGDGDPDLYVSNLDAPNRLYRNEGDGRFVDVATELGVTEPICSFPVWFWDFDNDGHLDLYVPSYGSTVADFAAHYSGDPPGFEPSRLYRNDGEGGFEDVTEQSGLVHPVKPMGCNYGDLDGDGFLDFHLGNGDPGFDSLMPNQMFHNRGGLRFEDITVAGGFGNLQKGHGVAFADLDHDGDLDVFAQLGGAFPGDRFKNALYENPGFDNRWVTLRLEGRRSNRCALGAHLHLRVEDEEGRLRSIHRHVVSGGSFGASPLRQTIGLGKARRIESLEITWPVKGSRERYEDLPLDAALHVVEGGGPPRPVQLRRLRLGKHP